MAKTSLSKRSSKKSRSKSSKAGKPGYTRTAGLYRRGNASVIEKKYKDTNVSMQLTTTSGQVQADYLVMKAGGEVSERVGNRVTVCNVNWRGAIKGWVSTYLDNTPVRVRTILGWDLQANGAAPNVTHILKEADVDSFRNMEYAARFKIIKDKTVVINPEQVAAAQQAEKEVAVRASWKGMQQIHYGDGLAALGSLRSANLFLLVISDHVTAGVVKGKIRVKYVDV